jgi:predicted porin
MKKSLIALAVAGAFAAPAFADTANVDVYGHIHMAFGVFNKQGTDVKSTQVTSNASRIGFKGTEDLGGGLKTIWQIESTVNPDERGGTLANRNSFVGLAGDFGTALIGTHDAPTKMVGRQVELFPDMIGDFRNLLSGATDTRPPNVVAYVTPNFSGFTGVLAYVNDLQGYSDPAVGTLPASSAPGAKKQSLWNGAVMYNNGPLYVGLSYAAGDALKPPTAPEKVPQWRLAGKYNIDDFTIVAMYDHEKNFYTGWMLGGAYQMGPIALKLDFVQAKNKTGDPAVDGQKSEQWSLGADYALSKRTKVYAMYTDVNKNDGQLDCGLGCGPGSSDVVSGNPADVGPGADFGKPKGFALGMIHDF